MTRVLAILLLLALAAPALGRDGLCTDLDFAAILRTRYDGPQIWVPKQFLTRLKENPFQPSDRSGTFYASEWAGKKILVKEDNLYRAEKFYEEIQWNRELSDLGLTFEFRGVAKLTKGRFGFAHSWIEGCFPVQSKAENRWDVSAAVGKAKSSVDAVVAGKWRVNLKRMKEIFADKGISTAELNIVLVPNGEVYAVDLRKVTRDAWENNLESTSQLFDNIMDALGPSQPR